MIRSSTAFWHGSGLKGKGLLTTESFILTEIPFSFAGRFAVEATGTNPEELLAAAHASCFTMKLSFVIGEAGFVPESLTTIAQVKFENGSITGSHLILSAKVPGISTERFEACVAEAENTCPVSRVLNTKITYQASLES
jgi:osmotically inducible protein OsmC